MVLCVPVMVISHYVSMNKKNKILIAEMEQPAELDEIDSTYAIVIKKDVVMEKTHLNSNSGGHQLIFYIEFLTEAGENILLAVPEENYEKIFVGQYGLLATISGMFLDFGDGEEI